jgi:hypothetical protein
MYRQFFNNIINLQFTSFAPRQSKYLLTLNQEGFFVSRFMCVLQVLMQWYDNCEIDIENQKSSWKEECDSTLKVSRFGRDI